MIIRRLRITSLLLVALCGFAAAAQQRFSLDLEAGPAWQLRNDFAVPGDSGTRVRLEDRGPVVAARATLTWQAGERWSLRFLAAPLATESEFVPGDAVRFQDTTFAAGETIRTEYRFDSYRAGAYYRFASSGRWSARAGATLKVRDASIELTSATRNASKTNTGVVPLLYGGLRLQMSPAVALDLEADAAAASQGRAVDARVRLERQLSDRASLFVGARILEGGADNDEVYSFGTFAYAHGGVRVTF